MNRQDLPPKPSPPRAQPTAPAPAAEGIEMMALFGALRRAKWMILGCIVVAGIIALAVLRGMQPQYISTVEVLLNTRGERVVGVEQVVSDLDVSNSVLAGEIAVLKSNLLLGQVVDELDLMSHPDFDPYQISEPGLISRALTAIGIGRAPSEPLPEGAGAEQGSLSQEDARNLVIWQVRRDLSVFQSGISYVIAISMRAEDPQIAAKIANAVAERYIADQLEAKLAATRRAISWLDNRLIELQTQLRDAEDAVVDFNAQQVLDEGADEQGLIQQLAQMNIAIVTARNDRTAAEARLTYIRDLLDKKGPEEAAAALSTPRLASLDTELATLNRQRAQLATRLGPEHPEMKALLLALADLERDRNDAIRAGVDELAAAVAEAQGREQAIRADIADAQQLQVDFSRSRVRRSQLERSASAMRQVYESFLSRFQETAQQLEFQRADARIISAAEPALSPARPRKKLILAVGLVLGAMVGVAAALIGAATDRSMRSAGALARLTGLPVLARLPELNPAARGTAWRRPGLPLRDLRRPRRGEAWQIPALGPRPLEAGWQLAELRGGAPSGYAEGLRMLRFSLMRGATGSAPRIILLSGADWSVGTSSTVLGLARVMADIGLNVVVVDANLRQPAQAGLLGLGAPERDISDFLTDNLSAGEVTLQEVEPGLSLVPARENSGVAADILSSPRMQLLIEALAKSHDVVLIDAPPAAGISDTAILADLADATVLVVRQRRTSEAQVLDALTALDLAGGNVAGTVLSHDDGTASAAPAKPEPARHAATEAALG